MAVRIVLVLSAFTVLYGCYGCGQASAPIEKQERKEGVEQVAEGEHPPIAGAVGENVRTSSFDLRVLDSFVTDHYYYLTDPSLDEIQDYFSQAGKFVVVNYSVTNTSPQTIRPAPMARLHVRAGDRVEVYDESNQIAPPHRFDPELALEDIPPRQMLVSQFIFDVPTDVEPELLAVTDGPTIYSSQDVGVVDLRENAPQGPRPEEIYALQMEYYNMLNYKRAYDLFAQESKARVSEQTFASKNERDDQRDPVTFTKYSFPRVNIEGDHATMQVVRSVSYEKEGQQQGRDTQEAVLEDEGWRIVMRDEQYKYYGG